MFCLRTVVETVVVSVAAGGVAAAMLSSELSLDSAKDAAEDAAEEFQMTMLCLKRHYTVASYQLLHTEAVVDESTDPSSGHLAAATVHGFEMASFGWLPPKRMKT